MRLKSALPILIAFASISVGAQDKVAPTPPQEIANGDLEEVITRVVEINDRLETVIVSARAASLISFSDPARSEAIFRQLWKLANEADKDSDKERAKLVILKNLFPRNPKLARSLMVEQPKKRNSSQSATITAGEESRLAGNLASQLIDADPSTAAALLESSLAIDSSPTSISALTRLREKDPFLSDYVAGKVLDSLSTRPKLASLRTLQMLAAYMFPGPEQVVSGEAESSQQSLLLRYFVISYDILRASLKETNEALVKDQHYSQGDLNYRAANQAQIAAILAALAPRLQPSLATELNEIAGTLHSQVPPNISQMTTFALARIRGSQLTSEDPEQRFAFALSNGDFAEARRQLDLLSDERKKDIYSQLTLKSEARSLLAKGDIVGALPAIRKLNNQTTRLVMYLDALKSARKKRDSELTNLIVNEARLLIPQVDRNGLHARAFLSFATQMANVGSSDDAVDFLSGAVTTINAVALRTRDQNSPKSMADAAMFELNNPRSLLDAPEMEEAFSSVGLVDLERTLDQAKRIELLAVQLTARLEAIQGVIKRSAGRMNVVKPLKAH